MMVLFGALQMIASRRGDGLHPEFAKLMMRPPDAEVESARSIEGPPQNLKAPTRDQEAPQASARRRRGRGTVRRRRETTMTPIYLIIEALLDETPARPPAGCQPA